MKCEICGKRIFLWYDTDVRFKICMDCFKKKAKGDKVKWLVSLKKPLAHK